MAFSRFFKHIFGILTWLMLLFFLVILYHYSVQYMSWKPETLSLIDKIYQATKIFLLAGFFNSVIGAIFHKIRHSRAIEKKLIRRYLPIINFFITTLTWVFAVFFILEAMGINTKNILA